MVRDKTFSIFSGVALLAILLVHPCQHVEASNGPKPWLCPFTTWAVGGSGNGVISSISGRALLVRPAHFISSSSWKHLDLNQTLPPWHVSACLKHGTFQCIPLCNYICKSMSRTSPEIHWHSMKRYIDLCTCTYLYLVV